jgi:flagellar protein FliS
MADLRRGYLDVGLATASPEKLLTMLWDRLILDLRVAEAALDEADIPVAGERLVHAQEIVFELRATLRLDAWDGAAGLSALYEYVEGRLVLANVRKDVAAVRECRSLLEPLQAAFHEAALATATSRAALVASA